MIVAGLFLMNKPGYDKKFGLYKFNDMGRIGFGFLFYIFGITFWSEPELIGESYYDQRPNLPTPL